MNSELQKAINKLLKGDPSRVCPTCNEFLTAPGEHNWEYCEACRRALHVYCTTRIDGSPFCYGCAKERAIEIAVEGCLEALRPCLEALRPHVAALKGSGDQYRILAELMTVIAATIDSLDYPTCPNCGNRAEPAEIYYRGEQCIGCEDCMGKRPAPPANPEVVSIRELTSSPSSMETPF